MVIKKIEIRPKGTGDYADVLYPKTSADMVFANDGTTFESHKADSTAHGVNLKANKTWETAIVLTLQNGWSGYLHASKNDLGEVYLRGELSAGTVAAGTVLSSLPVGYRIGVKKILNAWKGVPPYDGIVGVGIETSGIINMNVPLSNNIITGDAIKLNTIFRAEG